MRNVVPALLALSVSLAGVGEARASFTVESGWDLWLTLPTTSFQGVNFEGVPLGTFDFGGTIGVQNVGPTDTIVQRLQTVQVGGPGESGTTRLEMVALQLVSTAQVDLGAGLGFYYITLQSARGGPASLGTMEIFFDEEPSGPPPAQPVHGTFSSLIEVAFDLRFGSIDGDIVLSDILPLSSSDNPWSHYPPPGALEITGVNRYLSGQDGDRSRDFWPIGLVREEHPSGANHDVITTPEPSSIVLFGLGLFAAGVLGHRERSRARRSEPAAS